MRRLFFVVAVCLPVAVQIACAANNGDAITNPPRDAETLEAGTSRTAKSDDAGAPSRNDGGSDGGRDAAKDARAAADVDGPPPIVVINEIYVDIDGLGDGAELVELRADPGTPIDDLKLRVLDPNGAVDFEVDVAEPGKHVGASGLWVVGGAQTFKLGVQDRVDQLVSVTTWGLQTARGAVQLLRAGELLDVVSWATDADASALPPPATPPTSTGEGSPANVATIHKTASTPSHSFGRPASAADTNDNRADFCSMVASPGYAQKPCD